MTVATMNKNGVHRHGVTVTECGAIRLSTI